MYKILIRNRELEEAESPAYEKYSIYCEDNKEFETDDLNNALNKMNELLDKFLRVDLSLISKIEVNSELTTNLLKIVDISSNMISIINDGKTFSFKIDLSSLDEYTIVNVNNEIFDEVKTYLESLGFTNVRLTDTFEIVADNNTNNKIEGTITVKKGVKWSDGKQVVAKDLEYPYEMTANKATNSLRYSDSLANIVGMKAYHNGKAKTISGITYPDGENGRTIVIHFLAMKPEMLQSGNDYFIETAAPYHHLKDVPFSKLVSSDQIRKDPLFFGPYKVSKVVRGQSVTWVPNKYYWRGKPELNKIVAQVVSTKSASQAIKSHKFDIADVVNSDWQAVKNAKNTNFIAKIPLAYSYLGFKVGKWENGKNVMDKNSKMNNKSLRQAIAYAMNINQVEKRYTQGLTFRVPTRMLKVFHTI